ncbi:MAG: hypothetical protein KAK04_23390, partial [Cyclobacteriaceae bacterium]|nr:hypothetical protein [Cyclobacteriaceae bacterium]
NSMKSKSIIFIGIIVAIFICTTQLSGLTGILSNGDKPTDQQIQNAHKKQINDFILEKRKPIKHIRHI